MGAGRHDIGEMDEGGAAVAHHRDLMVDAYGRRSRPRCTPGITSASPLDRLDHRGDRLEAFCDVPIGGAQAFVADFRAISNSPR